MYLALLFWQAGLFYQFSLKEPQVSFKLNLNVLMECLGIFGSGSLTGQSQSPSLILHYDGYGEPLVLIMEEGMSQLIIIYRNYWGE